MTRAQDATLDRDGPSDRVRSSHPEGRKVSDPGSVHAQIQQTPPRQPSALLGDADRVEDEGLDLRLGAEARAAARGPRVPGRAEVGSEEHE